MFKIGGEFDDDGGEYGTDYDPNDVDPEKNPEISKDNDQDHDPFECPDYDNKDPDYDPFKCPDYDNKDPDYDPFKCPDYDNKDPDYDPFKCPDYDNEGENSPSALNSEMDDNPDNELDDPIKEYESESEPEKQPEGINNPSNSGTVSVIEPEQKPEHESEEKPEEFEVVTPNGEPERPGESSEVMEIRVDLEEWGHEPEYESEMEPESEYEQEPEKIPEQELETDPGQEQEEQEALEEFKRDKEGNIVLDAEQMEVFGQYAPSQEEMEVETLEEEMEEFFNSYEEQILEHKQGLEASHEWHQEISHDQQEENVNLEIERVQEQELSQELTEKNQIEEAHKSKEINTKSKQSIITEEELENYNPNQTIHRIKYSPSQEQKTKVKSLTKTKSKQKTQKVNDKMTELIKEHDEKESVQNSSQKKIQEIEQEFTQEKEQSHEQSQEIEQESLQKAHRNVKVIQKEIQEQVEEQKEQIIRERDNSFKELYKQETGRRPIYAGKETKEFIEWKEYLKEQEENQNGKNEIIQEKEKKIQEQPEEIRESKEEWVQYLANSIKEAEFSEDIKAELNELLEKYEDLRKLLEKLKNKESTEEKFENEVKKLESIFIEKYYIARSLFMNFDWFRRYYNGMIRKAGKIVAHLYISKKTREFLSYISGRIEQLQNIGNSQENAEKFKEFLEKSFQIKEKWALLLNRLIRETPNKEISTEVKEELGAVINMFCKIRTILLNKNILEEDKEKLIQERIEKCNPRFFELFEILKRFLGAYDNYSRKWMEQSLIFEGKKTVRRLSQKLENIKKENAIHQILNETSSSFQNFKEILKQNLYKTTELNMNEKSKIIKLIQKDKMTKEDKTELFSLLNRLPAEKFNLLHNRNTSSHPSGPNLSETERILIKNFIIDLLGTDPINNFKDIVYNDNFGSLRSIANHLGISRPTLRAHISTYLEILYGKEAVDNIFKLFWPNNFAKQREKITFYEIIEKCIRLYPERTSLIPTRNKLLDGELRAILSKNTFKPWVIDYLVQIKCYSLDESHAIYDIIWGKQCAKRKKIEYEDIKDFVHQRNHGKAHVLTPKIAFELMPEYPTDRYMKISCGEGHKFPIQVRKLIYDYNWCPYCNEHFCERMMRNYLGQFFNKEFEAQVRLEKACGIDREEIIDLTIEIDGIQYSIRVFVGQLRYDHFCPNVCIVGNNGVNYKYCVAGEYDGFHHDEENLGKNPFCDSIEDFAAINARDSVKNKVSYEKKVILIRLKEKDGFDRKKLLSNQKEVIQEIVRQFNKQVRELFGFHDVRIKYDPYIRFNPLGEGEPYRIKGSLDDFL